MCVLILGSASKVVRVTSVRISVTGSVSATFSVQLVKRSTADTGGTSTALTLVPYDSTNAAATATALAYTANPTLGTSVGNIRVDKLDAVTSGGNGSPQCDLGIRKSAHTSSGSSGSSPTISY